MGQFSMEKPALKGQFSVEINTIWSVAEMGMRALIAGVFLMAGARACIFCLRHSWSH